MTFAKLHFNGQIDTLKAHNAWQKDQIEASKKKAASKTDDIANIKKLVAELQLQIAQAPNVERLSTISASVQSAVHQLAFANQELVQTLTVPSAR